MNQAVDLAIVCFSGGHSSALAAIETVRKYGREHTVLINHNISSKVEDADIKRFKQEVSDYCGVPITQVNAPGFEELTPLEVCRRRKGFSAGTQHKFCTYVLKTEPFFKYLETIPKSPNVHIIYGFDADEPERINRKTDSIRAMGYTPEFPLADWNRTIEKTEDVGIERPSTYKRFKHANCIGCLKAGKQHWYCVYCLRPDIFEEAKKTEEEIGYSIIKGTYMAGLEPVFKEMQQQKRIRPTDRGNSAAFWAEVDKVLPEQESMFPCDCSF